MSVVIPKRNGNSGTRYFVPKFTKIVVGQTITWYNADDDSHSLIFDKEIIPYPAKIGDVRPRGTLSKKFDSYVPRIDYSCASHPEEKGTIVIYPKSEDQMTNTETLRHLTGFLGTEPPDILSHLRHKPTPYGTTLLPDISTDHITLERFLDSSIYKSLADPDLYQLQSKSMTIVFWDISHFSDLCNILNNQPVVITAFLREYCEVAIKTIHDHNGIVDKFMGDGILAFFGYKNNNDKTKGAIDAINAALELRKNFDLIKKKWMEMWSKHFGYNNISLDLKCGMHTGGVLFGLLATETRFQVTVVGSTVNLASRLESIAENDQIIISANVKYLAEDRYSINRIPVKNKLQSFPDINVVYEVKDVLV
jgi:class 3 adenylate cyclase